MEGYDSLMAWKDKELACISGISSLAKDLTSLRGDMISCADSAAEADRWSHRS